MDFNRSRNTRFNNLVNDDDRKNSFKSSKRPKRNNTPDNHGTGENRGTYLAPDKRGTINRPRDGGLVLSKKKIKEKEIIVPDTQSCELFPSLNENTQTNNTLEDQKTNLTVSFSNIAAEKESAPIPPKIINDEIKPGWVKLFRGPNGEFMREYGPSVPEPEFFARMREYEQYLAHKNLIETLERNSAYNREMDPYYDYHYPAYEDDYDEEEEYEEEIYEEYEEDEYDSY
jgi:hypothetical protein